MRVAISLPKNRFGWLNLMKRGMVLVQVFWAEGCTPCSQTKQFLEKEEIPYEAVQVLSMSDLPDGYMSIPVVKTDKGTWTGFNPAKLRELKNG